MRGADRDGEPATDLVEALARLAIVFLLAFGIGLERQLHRKPVGFGTFIFVATGTCALAITAVDLVPDNPLNLLSGTITGIGFLGAGALVRGQDRVVGFTTAALIWAIAALGIALGSGEYAVAFLLYGTFWAVIVTDRYLERSGFGAHARAVHLTLSDDVDFPAIETLMGRPGHLFDRVHWDRDAHTVKVTAYMRMGPAGSERLLRELRANPRVKGVEVE